MHALDWPSDITVWVNGCEVGTWTSPGDFGGTRGFLTPDWWELRDSQFGVLKTWQITDTGSYIDGGKAGPVTLEDLHIENTPYISVKVGIRPDAPNQGGLNIFGRGFGNYPADIVMRLDYGYPAGSKKKSGT